MTRKQSRQRAPKPPVGTPIFTCGACGKWCYPSRKTARAAVRALHDPTLQVYAHEGFWHIGHAPRAVSEGHLPRSALVIQPRPDRSRA